MLTEIRLDGLSGTEVRALIGEHLRGMAEHTPPESIHALGIEALRRPDITFWSAWRSEELAGCGALKELDPGHGEVKSMRTVRKYLRQGVAAALLQHILDEAQGRGYRRLSLETGSPPAFAPAQALYARFGFRRCRPFADYVDDPFSVYMTLEL